jgi:hypothetical protein
MKTAILSSDSDSDLKLLLALAKKLGIKTSIISQKDAEDMGLARAIQNGRTGEYVNTEAFISELKK